MNSNLKTVLNYGDKTILLAGPTAAGKTDLAVELAENHNYEIISVDSALIYRGMDIGTAKPDRDILQRAPHRLIDIVDPVESYSAASFCKDALREMEDIRSRGSVPLLVGGTMLYFKALQFGLSTLPKSDPVIRDSLDDEITEYGLDTLYQRLAKVDPLAAERISSNDPQRIMRALEVYELSGIAITTLQKNEKRAGLPAESVKMVAIAPEDRSVLHHRIEQRLTIMLKEGFIDEVKALRERGDLSLDTPSMRSVGYRQIWQYLDGELEMEEMMFRSLVATRQLAKRQLTWLRNWQSEIEWLIYG